MTRARSSASPALTQNSTVAGLVSHFLQTLLGRTSSFPSSRLHIVHQRAFTTRLRSQGPVASAATFLSFLTAPALIAARALAMCVAGFWRNLVRHPVQQKPTTYHCPSYWYCAVKPGRTSPPSTTQKRLKGL